MNEEPNKDPGKRPTVKVKHHSYQPSKAELEEDMRITDATPDEIARAVMRGANVQEIEE